MKMIIYTYAPQLEYGFFSFLPTVFLVSAVFFFTIGAIAILIAILKLLTQRD
jgi:hypothetical protein